MKDTITIDDVTVIHEAIDWSPRFITKIIEAEAPVLGLTGRNDGGVTVGHWTDGDEWVPLMELDNEGATT